MDSSAVDDAPQRFGSRTFVVVGGCLALIMTAFGVWALYDAGVAITPTELAWVASQRAEREPASAPLDDATRIELTRTGCFGRCPAYRVAVTGSGRVEFAGGRDVCVTGAAAGTADARAVRRLIDGLQVIGFEALPAQLTASVTDLPTVTLSVTRDGVTRTVEHYGGDLAAPRVLRWAEEQVDRVAGTSAWVRGADGAGCERAAAPGERATADG